ncbi:MAG: 4a-hydroxytetrahydrobiopterin dehydratase [Bacteroidota bacterium]
MEALSEQAINEALTDLDGWDHDEDMITCGYEFKHFKEALGFIVQVGLVAEQKGHHPEIFNVYNKVVISLQTHDAGNKVTQTDIDMARAIEELF